MLCRGNHEPISFHSSSRVLVSIVMEPEHGSVLDKTPPRGDTHFRAGIVDAGTIKSRTTAHCSFLGRREDSGGAPGGCQGLARFSHKVS
jgi:hypothetical protein